MYFFSNPSYATTILSSFIHLTLSDFPSVNLLTMKFSVSALWIALAAISTAEATRRTSTRKGVPKDILLDKLPDSGEHWQSLKNGVEFQPAQNLSPLAEEHLRRMVDKEYNQEASRRTTTSTRKGRRAEEEQQQQQQQANAATAAAGTYAPTDAATEVYNGEYEEDGSSNYTAYYNASTASPSASPISMNYQYQNGDMTDDDAYSFGDTTTFNGYPQGTVKGGNSGFDSAMSKIYLDGAETYYDEYSQAWRALGFYIDCDQTIFDQFNGRKLQEGDDHGDDRQGCQRFMLWAAYIDEYYSGNGAHEYKYYNRKSKSWNGACRDEDDNASTRCVKMDCHLPNTHFTLLGYFKEPNYDEWMEQLFKHEGDCVWTDDEYHFMQQNREAWPHGCTETIFQDDYNQTIYYDVKPATYGNMDIGLYLDDLCVKEYTGGSMTAHQAIQRMYCGGYLEEEGDDRDDQGCDGGDNQEDSNCGGGDGQYDNYTSYASYVKTYKQLTTRCNMCGGSACYTLISDFNETVFEYDVEYLESYSWGDDGDDDGDQRNEWWNQEKPNLWNLESDLEEWNSAFDVFKQCLPCKAGALTDLVSGEEANQDGDRYGDGGGEDGADQDGGRRRMEDQDGGDEDEDDFHCHDDADYDNVNQCMKFATHTRMIVASFNDVTMAAMQGSLTEVSLSKNVIANYSGDGDSDSTEPQQAQNLQDYFRVGKGLVEKELDETKYFVSVAVMMVSALFFGGALYKYRRAVLLVEFLDASEVVMSEPLVVANDVGVVAA